MMEWWQILLIVFGSVLLLLVLSIVLYKPFFKRFWDIVLSGIAIIVLSPLLLVLTIVGAIAMGGNPFFTQKRPGKKRKNGEERIFRLIKFRTMSNVKDDSGNLLPDEQRLNGYGKFLRSTSLDEFPELLNIFIGDMSIVGPRPLLVKYLPFYTEQQRHRHNVRPGLTGYAQAHGRNGVDWDSKLEMDVWYVNDVSLFGDLKIILDTAIAVLKRDGINQEGQATMEDFSEYVKNKQMSNKKPLISVIVPIYGIEKYVGVCIESIINQTYSNLEIILVDDGSPDKCGEICDSYAKKDSRIKVIHKKNGGLVSARKAGIQIASGEYATYVDGDDWIEEDYYQSLVEQIDASDVIVSGHKRALFEKVVQMPLNFEFGQYQGKELDNVKKTMISHGKFFKTGVSTYVWNKLFKTELLKKYQMLVDDDITIGEDAAVVYPLMNEAKKIVFANVFGYMYRQREDSMLKKAKPFLEETSGLRKLYEYLSVFAKNNPGYDYDKQVNDFVLGICIIRSGGIKFNKMEVLPFNMDFAGKNVAIYSAGTFGQQLVRRIEENSYCHISCWVDDDHLEYKRCSLEVEPIDYLKEKEFDYLLIATIDTDHAERIKSQLIKIGVQRNKILSIECKESSRKRFLENYLGERT